MERWAANQLGLTSQGRWPASPRISTEASGKGDELTRFGFTADAVVGADEQEYGRVDCGEMVGVSADRSWCCANGR